MRAQAIQRGGNNQGGQRNAPGPHRPIKRISPPARRFANRDQRDDKASQTGGNGHGVALQGQLALPEPVACGEARMGEMRQHYDRRRAKASKVEIDGKAARHRADSWP